jgi:hypothetical protein
MGKKGQQTQWAVMRRQRIQALHRALFATATVLALHLVGCRPVSLIAPYDQKIDDGVTALQQMTATFLTQIDRQEGSTSQEYSTHVTFYDAARIALSGLLVRASAVPKNTLTTHQLAILRQQFQHLEQEDQRNGIPHAAVPHLEAAFNRTFLAILTLEVAKKEPKV